MSDPKESEAGPTPPDKGAGGGRRPSACSPRYRPFSSGYAFLVWTEDNCCRCTKCPPPDHEGPNEACDIENAFVLAAVCGGTINDPVIGDESKAREIAERLGWDGEGPLPARCREIVEKCHVCGSTHLGEHHSSRAPSVLFCRECNRTLREIPEENAQCAGTDARANQP